MLSFRKKVCTTMAAVFLLAMLTPSVIAVCDLASPEADASSPEAAEMEITLLSYTTSYEEAPAQAAFSDAEASGEAETGFGVVTDSSAEVEITVDGRPRDPEHLSFVLNGVTYAPLRDLCTALGAQTVTFEPSSRTVTVLSDGLELTVPLDERYLTANGRYLYVENGFILKNGVTMAPVRTICTAFGASLLWSPADSAIYISSGAEPILPGEAFYDAEELDWMTRIIHAEAGGEPFLGKIAVGNVIMNRVADGNYPGDVYDVIFDSRFGVQFTPTINGAIYSEPDDQECVVAAKLALDGADVIGDAMYFSSAYLSCWASRNRPFLEQIGSHAFYA